MSLIDYDKWHAVWNGLFSYSIIERDKYWTLDDDAEFDIACDIKSIIGKKCPLM